MPSRPGFRKAECRSSTASPRAPSARSRPSPGEPAPEALAHGPVFSDASLCLEAAISSRGGFLTFETLAAYALDHGRLVEPFTRRRATGNAYWLMTAEGHRPSGPVRLFCDWLRLRIVESGLGAAREG